jgi:hypothetical protein
VQLSDYFKQPYKSDYNIFTHLFSTPYAHFNQGSPADLFYASERDKQFDLALRGDKSAQQAMSDLQHNVEQDLKKALAHFHG